jgi:hypothetical protein
MPGILKIGRSIDGGKQRAAALYSTGVPEKFVLEFEVFVTDPIAIEKSVHEALSLRRIKDSREFFRCEVFEAAELIINEQLSCFDRAVCNAEERHILDCIYESIGATEHHFMTGLYSLEGLTASYIDRLVQKNKNNSRGVH